MTYDMRVGIGFDIHRLIEGRRFIIGGMTIPFERGPIGHSDGDTLVHALIDALLGAAGLGDIGTHFPPDDEQYKDADSMDMLKHVVDMLDGRMLYVSHVDAVVMCEQPKLSPFYEQIRTNLAKALRISVDQVSVKATTMERLGPIGAGEAIAAQAVALVEGQM
ncbi:MAG TPA: 2-C-methyl-D-erythritol 2,4-cyclodiphosphate synthase [Candidatus Obscuribacterales bacterium]